MSKFSKFIFVSFLFLFSADLLPAAAARQAAVRMAAGMSAAAVGIKMAQVHQKQQAVIRKNELGKLTNTVEKDWFEKENYTKFKKYPYATALIAMEIRKKGLDLKEFALEFCEKEEIGSLKTSTFIISLDEWSSGGTYFTLCLAEKDIEEVNDTLRRKNFNDYRTSKKDGLQTKKEHLDKVIGIIGHELIHATEHKNNSWKIWQKKVSIELQREEEKRADLHASHDPEVLRALAKYFEHQYNQSSFWGKFIYNFFLISGDEHPHSLERARYLREKAYQIETRKNYLMLSN